MQASQILAELGPVLTGERDLANTAGAALDIVMAAVRASSGALFRFQDKPPMLSSIANIFTHLPAPRVRKLFPASALTCS